MGFEFDHLFICTDVGAGDADQLVSLGLTEGTRNTHPGQGTANRRFFFHNATLELLWVHDADEAKSELIRPTRLWDRWANRKNSLCPFGICLRPETNTSNEPAFASWAYHPPYLPETLSIAVGTNSDVLTEPMLFQTPFGKRPDQQSPERAQPLKHDLGLCETTSVELISPVVENLSPELKAVIDTGQAKLRVGKEYCVKLGFDGEVQGHQVDFRPGLPLIMSW